MHHLFLILKWGSTKTPLELTAFVFNPQFVSRFNHSFPLTLRKVYAVSILTGAANFDTDRTTAYPLPLVISMKLPTTNLAHGN